MNKNFKCVCGATSLAHSGNFRQKFPNGQVIVLCSGACPKKNEIRRKADKAWKQFRAAKVGSFGTALVNAGYFGRPVAVKATVIVTPAVPRWAKKFPGLYAAMMA